MALVLADRVQETTTTAGTGTVTLAGAVAGYQSFATIGNGNTTYYTLVNDSNWEVGVGTYTSSGTTLSRDTVLASSAGGTTKITLSGTTSVFVTYPAERSVNLSSAALTSGRVPYATTNGLLTDAAGFTFSGTVLAFPSPFTLGSTSVTSTGTQLNYLSAATGTTGTTSTSLVFSAAPAITGIATTDLFATNNNAVSVSGNAGTCSQSFELNTFTNSSAATMTITLAVSTPTPKDGQKMIVRIYDFSAVAQTISWVNTENSTQSVPTTSNGSTTLPLTVGFLYNAQTSKWRCVASA
jgi:hypothetical protein